MAFTTTGPRVVQRLRLRPAPKQTDFADFGTAFGLELSLQADPTQGPASTAREPGWWRRLSARHFTLAR